MTTGGATGFLNLWPPAALHCANSESMWTMPCAGVNGAGKTTQLQIIMGRLLPDGGEIIKARRNMRIAYLAQVRPVGVVILKSLL